MIFNWGWNSIAAYFPGSLWIGSTLVYLPTPPLDANEDTVSDPKTTPKGGYAQEEIGITAGAIWKALHANGELSLSQLKKHTNAKTPLFGSTIGWLARENKITLTQQRRSIRVRLV